MIGIVAVCIILCCLSLVLLLGIIILYSVFRKKLLRYPNKFYYYSLICQFIDLIFLLILLVLIQLDIYNYGHPSMQAASAVLYIMYFFYLLSFNYIIILNRELFRKFSQSFKKCSSARLKTYHFVCISVSTCTIVLYYLVNDETQYDSDDQGVEIQIFALYLGISSIIIWVYAIRLISKKFFSRYRSLTSLIISSLFYAVSNGALFFDPIIRNKEKNSDQDNYMIFQYVLFSVNGMLQCLAILANRKFLLIIKRQILNRRSRASLLEMGERPSDLVYPHEYRITLDVGLFSDLLEGIVKNTVIQIVVSTSLFYIEYSLKGIEKKKYKFNKLSLTNLKSIINFNFIDKSKKYLVNPSNLALNTFKKRKFKTILERHSNPNILSSLLDPKTYEKITNLKGEEGGRSNSFIFVTADNKFILKTITKAERKIFTKKILNEYSNHIFCKKNSKIVRIFGVFELSEYKINFIIMENIIYNKPKSVIFDLKGSKVDREVKGISDPRNPPCGVLLKDVNFCQFEYRLNFGETKNREILQELREDFFLLKSLKIMDYSILLAICVYNEEDMELNRYSMVDENNQVLSIGVIDFFQKYSLGKKGETTVKSLFNKKDDISSTNPEKYYTRIIEFTESLFVQDSLVIN